MFNLLKHFFVFNRIKLDEENSKLKDENSKLEDEKSKLEDENSKLKDEIKDQMSTSEDG